MFSRTCATKASHLCVTRYLSLLANTPRSHYVPLQSSNCASSTISGQSTNLSVESISSVMSRLSLDQQVPFTCISHIKKQEYILPTLQHQYIYKKTILDPQVNPKTYDLPTFNNIVRDKLTPSLPVLIPMEDPHTLQRVIEQGTDISKQANPKLVTIRRAKMKKHQRKKLAKRMHFVWRARKLLKKERKEKALKEMEAGYRLEAEKFNAEQYINDQLSLAREGGFGIDIWANKRKAGMESSQT